MLDKPGMTIRKLPLLLAGGLVCLIASACSLTQNLPTAMPPTATSTSQPTAVPTISVSSPTPQLSYSGGLHASSFPEIQRVSLEQAKAALDAKSAVFLDVRSKASYDSGHIPGALSMPLAELETRLKELDPNQWIITYCT